MARKFHAATAFFLLLTSSSFAAEPVETTNVPTNRIIAQARADLTPTGAAWTKEEAQRLLSGQVQPFEVAQDAAAVTDGVVTGGTPDELVLIALIEAQNAKGGTVGRLPESPNPPSPNERATRTATLEQSIANLLQTLSDTQRPAPREKP